MTKFHVDYKAAMCMGIFIAYQVKTVLSDHHIRVHGEGNLYFKA